MQIGFLLQNLQRLTTPQPRESNFYTELTQQHDENNRFQLLNNITLSNNPGNNYARNYYSCAEEFRNTASLFTLFLAIHFQQSHYSCTLTCFFSFSLFSFLLLFFHISFYDWYVNKVLK